MMRLRLPLIVTLAACIAPAVAASQRTTAAPVPARNTNPTTPPARPSAETASSPATPRPETLEEIVARVQRRLAMETPRGGRPVAPRPPVIERVKLVWRPAVVWPSELAGLQQAPPPSVPTIDPNPAASTRP
jgi:hypothetical protein